MNKAKVHGDEFNLKILSKVLGESFCDHNPKILELLEYKLRIWVLDLRRI